MLAEVELMLQVLPSVLRRHAECMRPILADEHVLKSTEACRMRTCSSDTALDQLDGSDVKAQSLKHQAGYPNPPAQQAAANGSVLATPPRKHVSRSTSDPPERSADNTAKLAATRHATSARIAQVRPGTCWLQGIAESCRHAAAVLVLPYCGSVWCNSSKPAPETNKRTFGFGGWLGSFSLR